MLARQASVCQPTRQALPTSRGRQAQSGGEGIASGAHTKEVHLLRRARWLAGRVLVWRAKGDASGEQRYGGGRLDSARRVASVTHARLVQRGGAGGAAERCGGPVSGGRPVSGGSPGPHSGGAAAASRSARRARYAWRGEARRAGVGQVPSRCRAGAEQVPSRCRAGAGQVLGRCRAGAGQVPCARVLVGRRG